MCKKITLVKRRSFSFQIDFDFIRPTSYTDYTSTDTHTHAYTQGTRNSRGSDFTQTSHEKRGETGAGRLRFPKGESEVGYTVGD